MICINNDVYIESRNDLREFSDLLNDEIYNEDTENIVRCLTDYFYEVWSKTNVLENEVKKRIDFNLFVVAYLNFDVTDNFSEIKVELCSAKDFKMNKKAEVIFESLFDRYFKKIRPLNERLSDL